MAAVVGYLVAASIAIIGAWRVAGARYVVKPDPTFELPDVAARQVTVLGGLAGFAVTGIVFLVTQAHNNPDPGGTSFKTVLAMFVVAYMGYFSSSLLFANVSHRGEGGGFYLASAQYAGASINLYFTVFIGWFALRPLFETFSLTSIADLVGWFLIWALIVGYGLLASALYRSGYASARMIAVLPLFAAIATVGYGILVQAFAPSLRSSEATLALTIIAFMGGAVAYAVMTLLPVAARSQRLAPILADRWHLALIAYAQGVMVLLGFLLLSIFGLA